MSTSTVRIGNETYTRSRVLRYMKNIVAAAKRHHLRKQAHTDLHSQIDRVEKVSLSGKNEEHIQSEVADLRKKLDLLLSMRGQNPEFSHDPHIQSNLRRKIYDLELKLNKLLEKKSDHEARMEHVEKNINEKLAVQLPPTQPKNESDDLVHILHDRLGILKQKYELLKKDKTKASQLKRVENKLELTKKLIERAKKKKPSSKK